MIYLQTAMQWNKVEWQILTQPLLGWNKHMVEKEDKVDVKNDQRIIFEEILTEHASSSGLLL